MPWKKLATIGGVLIKRTVRSKPIPPCCIAMEVMPVLKLLPNKLPKRAEVQNAPATGNTRSIAIAIMDASTASDNIVPIPYSNHRWKRDLVESNNRHKMKIGPKPTNSASATLYINSVEPPTMAGPAVPTPIIHIARFISSKKILIVHDLHGIDAGQAHTPPYYSPKT